MTVFFISDTHFGHKNIIKYDNRPFSSSEEMDEYLIEAWNSVVKDGDDVYHLGDFAFHKENKCIYILSRLKGNKYLIYGNHCGVIKESQKIKSMFASCRDYHELKVGKDLFVLFHYPIGEWNKCHKGSYHLHGHCHGHYKYPFNGRIMDVGAPCIGYKPISLEDVISKLRDKEIITHH